MHAMITYCTIKCKGGNAFKVLFLSIQRRDDRKRNEGAKSLLRFTILDNKSTENQYYEIFFKSACNSIVYKTKTMQKQTFQNTTTITTTTTTTTVCLLEITVKAK